MFKQKLRRQSVKNKLSASEKRYNGIISRVRGLRNKLTKQQETELAYMVNDIDSYGFNFFANHYTYEKVDNLEKYVNSIQK